MDVTTIQNAGADAPRMVPSDPETILEKGRAVLAAEANAIRDARERIDGTFARVVDAILQCRGRVCVTGVGKARIIGEKIQATLASTGTLSYNLHAVEALHGDLGMVHSDDVVLALSKSGSSELVELLPRLKELGCCVILLTANPESDAARSADHVLHIGETPEACPLGLAPSSSTAAMLALGDALALIVMELKAVAPEQYAAYHPGGALGRFLMKARAIMRTGANCPTVVHTASLAECYEAILSAPMRAGAATVVDDEARLAGIITQGDFFRLLKGNHSLDRPVTEVMTSNPKRIGLDARVTDALAIMRRHAIDELPVVDDEGRVVGLIDVQDLIARGFSAFTSA